MPVQSIYGQSGADILAFVDALIGTLNGGHVFPGASLPFSMAKTVADTNGDGYQGGFASDGSNITGFSHMHDSGTGGSPSLGNFPLFPQSGCPDDELDNCLFTKVDRATPRINGTVEAHPGYFAVEMASKVRTEMTVSNHTALYRFTFPEQPSERNTTLSPLILADLTDLPDSRINGSISVDEGTGRISGSGSISPSFGIGSYTAYFCADFSEAKVRDTGVFMNKRAGTEPKNLTVTADGINISPEILPAGAWTRFRARRLRDLSKEPCYDSFYCIWDSFRSIHSLITLVDPVSQARMVRSLIDIYRYEGWLPDCRMSLCKGFTQGGSNADVVLAESYLKGITDGIDWATGYKAVAQDAEVEPSNWAVEGRGGLTSWKNLHYTPADDFDPYGVGPFTRSISRTGEYAYDDFCITEMARGLGNQADYEKYLARSEYWQNLYLASQTSYINATNTNYTGFLQPRFSDGTFGYQDPIFCSPLLNSTSCYLKPNGHETYEGSAWLYTFFAPHDTATLIGLLGGPDTFVKRLDYFHTSGLLYIGDEQGFLNVFLYHYAGRPGKSAERAHYYIPSQFNDTLAGIPGNDDSGAMGSFAALTMMGIFPAAGQDVCFVTPPFFEEVSVRNKVTGKTAVIRNVGFDPSYQAIYIQSATWDGAEYTKNWIGHDFFRDGGVLELTLGKNESAWGTREQDLPPSASTRGY
ncbi:hypothetical protein B0A48_09056 [Cryoendolithus antarcticus]|uniref:Glycosyl hydrolase family 92 domain-containing protein n=1 Tax=Cryoendolithus antarcticus TaxID=1507870 RepID=A0A1V8T1V1_9PEZI|nr:hypothetical protein B0A48_09056 [Cryoendolithus antarcticus]